MNDEQTIRIVMNVQDARRMLILLHELKRSDQSDSEFAQNIKKYVENERKRADLTERERIQHKLIEKLANDVIG